MKEVKAIVQPFKVSDVVDALQTVPGVGGITALDVRGFGRTRGRTGLEVEAGGSVNYVTKVMLVLVVPDQAVDDVLNTIQRSAHTGNLGDGKIFVSDVVEALKIRTGDRGPNAL